LVPLLQPETMAARATREQARAGKLRRTAAHIIGGRMVRTLTFSLACVCVLAGCGSSNGGGGKSVTVPASQPIAVTATEYKFDPGTITVTGGGGSVRFDLKNAGSQAHDLHVTKGGQDVGGTAVFGPDQSQGATVKLSPGTYEFICTVGNHADLGMKGKLVVQ
jgi:plastocyanin